MAPQTAQDILNTELKDAIANVKRAMLIGLSAKEISQRNQVVDFCLEKARGFDFSGGTCAVSLRSKFL